jgi:hypothetical protein
MSLSEEIQGQYDECYDLPARVDLEDWAKRVRELEDEVKNYEEAHGYSSVEEAESLEKVVDDFHKATCGTLKLGPIPVKSKTSIASYMGYAERDTINLKFKHWPYESAVIESIRMLADRPIFTLALPDGKVSGGLCWEAFKVVMGLA